MLLDEEIKHRAYTPYGGARQLWGCRDDEVLMDGPAGTGKTRGILEKIHLCANKYPRSRHLICRKTRESMTESVLVTLEEKVLPEDSYLIDGPQRNLRQRYNYDNGSVIVVGGMDKPSKIMSTEYDTISFFEGTEFSEEDLEMVSTRLRNGRMPYQQIMVDCNPGSPNHWLNKRPETKNPNDEGKLMTRILSRHEDNPTLFDMKLKIWRPQGQRYLNRLDKLSGHRYLRLRKGLWVAAEGLVYDIWDTNVHLVNKFIPPPSWRKIRVIDFGYTNPFVCLWIAIDEDGRMWVYREIYHTKRLVSDHAAKIKELSGDEKYEATISDHDSESRATLHDCGINTHPAWKPIQPGIEAVTNRLRKAVDDRPRLFIMRDCRVELDNDLVEAKLPTSTTEEFDSYMYPPGTDTKTPRAKKEDPIDKDNHGMDSLRYAVAYVDNITGMILNVTAEKAQVINGRKS
jgi:PBSX family phage terminase large subunit